MPIFAHRMEQNPAHPGTPGSSPSPRRCHNAEAPARVNSKVSGLSLDCCCILPCPRSPFRVREMLLREMEELLSAPSRGAEPRKEQQSPPGCLPQPGAGQGPGEQPGQSISTFYSSRGTPRQPNNYTGPSLNHLCITCVAQPPEPTAKLGKRALTPEQAQSSLPAPRWH